VKHTQMLATICCRIT